LIVTLDDWLAPFLVGATGVADVAALDVGMLLGAQLSWDRSVELAEAAPPTLTTAAGRVVDIDYTGDAPLARVRVQDMFGTARHPTVAGDVPIVLELLSPADRAIQVTADLPGFWAGGWTDVRKEMAGRYPKHHWPVDPAAAPPKRLK
jgi:ATP-dependent helicase HrpB